jgi:Protein of unknown function (DUF742)
MSDNSGLVRPFLTRQTSSSAAHEAPQEPQNVPVVRAYMMTGGRTTSDGVKLEFETMLSLSAPGRRRQPQLLFEQAKIANLVGDEHLSVAEIAVKINVPVGVAQVLCGDMVGEGLLEQHAAAANLSQDVSLLTRLINGVRAL